jgi:hypothetical protein
MSDPRNFATDVRLACSITCGTRRSVRFTGTALQIDSRTVTVKLPSRVPKAPKLSEMMSLDISVPNPSKYLHIRGLVTRIDTLPNGERYVEIQLRSARFRDVNASNSSKN